MAISNAVGQERVSRVTGYSLSRGFFTDETPNLPQLVAVFGEANTANQTGLTTDKVEITTAQQAGERFGFGSPLHQMFRILRPPNGGGIGGIRTFAFPQISDQAATPSTRIITITGTATANTTHTALINGRTSVDFQTYTYAVVNGDTATVIAGKIVAAVNSVIGAPVIASNALGVITFTSKWEGETAEELNVSFNTGSVSAGLTYSQTGTTAGSGVVSLAASLNQFGSDWYTSVINPYGESQFDALEQFNGTPAVDNPIGRYNGLIFMPFMAYFGSTLSSLASILTITNNSARLNQVTNVLCPAPNSEGFSFEAAANVALLVARQHQDSPHTDINAQPYPDMPVPTNGDIGDDNRDVLVKNGASTVILNNGRYEIQDLVTTYHPAGETPLIFSYSRNLNIDFNISFRYRLLEERFVRDKALIPDDQITQVPNTIKPKDWRAIIFGLFDELGLDAVIQDVQFSKDSLRVEISSTNPNRFETVFDYRRSGLHRIGSTDVSVGF
jgi:phage tail sheath gpL-like